MFTKAQVYDLPRGFHVSSTGRHPKAPTGRGTEFGNRAERRKILSSKGLHDNKSGIMLVTPTGKFVSRLQTIFSKDKLGFFTGQIKKILHWDEK